MDDDITRAQHYRALAAQMRDFATIEPEMERKAELEKLAHSYERIAAKLLRERGAENRR